MWRLSKTYLVRLHIEFLTVGADARILNKTKVLNIAQLKVASSETHLVSDAYTKSIGSVAGIEKVLSRNSAGV